MNILNFESVKSQIYQTFQITVQIDKKFRKRIMYQISNRVYNDNVSWQVRDQIFGQIVNNNK